MWWRWKGKLIHLSVPEHISVSRDVCVCVCVCVCMCVCVCACMCVCVCMCVQNKPAIHISILLFREGV